MSHDLIAELAGFQAELAGAEQRGNKERATAVRAEIDRVIGGAVTFVEQLLARAENHEAALEDLSAAKLRVEARRLAGALPEEKLPKHLRALRGPASADAAQSTPQETATPGGGKARPAAAAAGKDT